MNIIATHSRKDSISIHSIKNFINTDVFKKKNSIDESIDIICVRRLVEKNGVIYMIPVSIYPKKYVEELEKIAAQTKHGIEDGSIPVFDNVDDMFNSLDED